MAGMTPMMDDEQEAMAFPQTQPGDASMEARPTQQGDASMEQRPDDEHLMKVADNQIQHDQMRTQSAMTALDPNDPQYLQKVGALNSQSADLSQASKLMEIHKTAAMPKYTGPGKSVAMGQMIPENQVAGDEANYHRYGNDADYQVQDKKKQYDQRILAAEEQGDHVTAGNLRLAKAEYERQNPYGSAGNHPGMMGKIGHVLGKVGEVAANVAMPGVTSVIPGTSLYRANQRHGAMAEIELGQEGELKQAQAQAAGRTKGTNDEQALNDMMHGGPNGGPRVNPETNKPFANVQEANVAIEKAKAQAQQDAKPDGKLNIDNMIADASQKAVAAGKDPNADPTVMQLQQVKKGEKNEDQEKANKQRYEKIVQDVAAAGGNTDPAKLGNSIAKSKLSAEDKAFAAAYGATHNTPATSLTVHVEGAGQIAQQKAAAGKAGKYYTYSDNNGTHLVTGDKIPEGLESEPLPIKDPQQLIGEAHASNTVQQSLNRLNQDIDEHPEIWDANSTRDVIAEATGEINQVSALGVAVPSSIMEKISARSQLAISNPTSRAAVQQYIADYKAAKDKALVLQMEMQNGKMGRGSAQAFASIIGQLPGQNVASSEQARRLMDNLQRTQSEMNGKYPEKYGDYTKENVYQRKHDSGKGGNNSQPDGVYNPATGMVEKP